MIPQMRSALTVESLVNLAQMLIVWQDPMPVVPVKRTMIKKILHFLERDQDITLYDEFHYVYITLEELVKVIRTRNK
jgi:hypothetical protein